MVSPTVSPQAAQAVQAGSFDLLTPIILILPLAMMLLLLLWGSKRKERKSRVIELSYVLISVELILIILTPACSVPFSCGAFAAIPVIMFIMLVFFIFHRSRKEAQHEMRVIKALKEGHIKHSDVVAARLEDEIKRSERQKAKAKEVSEKLTEASAENDATRPPKQGQPPKKAAGPKWWILRDEKQAKKPGPEASQAETTVPLREEAAGPASHILRSPEQQAGGRFAHHIAQITGRETETGPAEVPTARAVEARTAPGQNAPPAPRAREPMQPVDHDEIEKMINNIIKKRPPEINPPDANTA